MIGSDTTATALAATLYYLSHNQHCLTKLHDELKQFKFTEELVYKNLSHLTYLNACIEEALRMNPPLGGALWRTADTDLLLENQYIPAGVMVGTPMYAIHHNKEYYPEPFKYQPDRWLNKDSQKAKNAFCAFQIGLRGCVGKSLAYMELKLAVAKIVFSYDMRVAEEVDEGEKVVPGGKEYRTKDQMTSWQIGPMLQFKARNVTNDEKVASQE